MRIALIDSGLGLLATSAALAAARPDTDLVLSINPSGVPWGPRTPEDITERVLAAARATEPYSPDVIVLACNTASVVALDRLRAEYEPAVPVVGTVPAIKPASAGGGSVAIWATPATTASAYQRNLIERFGGDATVTGVACDGLADAIEAGSAERIGQALAFAVDRTPADVTSLVIGCTHYDLITAEIQATLGRPVQLFTAAGAVAAQTLRRLGVEATPGVPRTGTVTVLADGEPAELPRAAKLYPAGLLLDAPSDLR